MSSVKLNTTSGGSVTVAPTNTASHVVMQVPAENGTLLSTAAIGVTVQAYNANTVTAGGSATLTNKTIEAGVFTNGYTEESVVANTNSAYTIDLTNGTVQILTLTGSCTYTFPTPVAGKSFMLVQKQDGVGGRTVTWAGTTKWPGNVAPTITSTASKADLFSFVSDGTNWFGRVIGQNYL